MFLLYSSKLLWDLRQDAATCLGLLCTVLSYEAESIFKWLFLKLTSNTRDEVKLLYLMATYHALEAAGEKKAFSHVMQVIISPKGFFHLFWSSYQVFFFVPKLFRNCHYILQNLLKTSFKITHIVTDNYG